MSQKVRESEGQRVSESQKVRESEGQTSESQIRVDPCNLCA
jgi:hypothetical protein